MHRFLEWIFVVLLLAPSPVSAVVTVDNVGSGGMSGPWATAISWTQIVGTGSNPAVFICINMPQQPTSVTMGGYTGDLVTSLSYGPFTDDVWLYQVIGPAPGTYTVTVAAPNFINEWTGNSISLNNVNQVSPTTSIAKNQSTTGTIPVTVTVNNPSGNLMMDCAVAPDSVRLLSNGSQAANSIQAAPRGGVALSIGTQGGSGSLASSWRNDTGPIGFKQTAQNTAGLSSGVTSLSLNLDILYWDFLYCVVYNSGGSGATSVTQGSYNFTHSDARSSGGWQQWYYAGIPIQVQAQPITASFSSPVTAWMYCAAWGGGTVAGYDVSTSNLQANPGAGSGVITSGSKTTTTADLLIGFTGVTGSGDSSPISEGPGFTPDMDVQLASRGGLYDGKAEHLVQSSSASRAVTFTDSAGGANSYATFLTAVHPLLGSDDFHGWGEIGFSIVGDGAGGAAPQAPTGVGVQ